MTNKEFLLELIRLIKPKYFNKLTWLLVSSGLLLVSPPVITIILSYIINGITEFNLIGTNDKYWGIALIILATLFNIISQIINGKSLIKCNFIFNRDGNVTINQPTYIVTDNEKLDEILKALSKSNQSFTQNYVQSKFSSNFSELFKSLPWVRNIELAKLENDIEIFKISYETSDHSIKYFFINIYNVKDSKLVVSDTITTEIAYIPNVAFIYWEKLGYWTLNTYDIFTNFSLTSEIAIKNDISNIIGDLTFVINELKLRLTYDKSISDDSFIKHPEHGSLSNVELHINGKYQKIEMIELGIIDSNFKTKMLSQEHKGDITIVTESIAYTHIFKLSTLLIRFMSESNTQYITSKIIVVRKIIIEFMKKSSSKSSYSIPNSKTKQTDHLFKEAFNNTWVYERFEERK
ncbi:MAG: hypothetical protein GQ564_04045 [Bacteroidales bacterium]|nr:hypothetical protein [Bacteroidales bacterium]